MSEEPSNLSQAKLIGTYLNETNLSRVNLSEAIISISNIINSNLTSTELTGACIQDCNISGTILKEISCSYFYEECKTSSEKEKYLLSERRPRNPDTDFAPGEFAVLLQQAKETVDLIFVDGIDWKAFFLSFEKVRSQYNNQISIQAIERKNDGDFVIRIEVSGNIDEITVQSQLEKEYKYKLKLIETEYRVELNAKDREIEIYKQKSTELIEIIKYQTTRPVINVETTNVSGDQFNNSIQNSTIANFANQMRDNASQNASQFSQTIGQNADDIAKLIDSLYEKAQEFSTDLRDDLQIKIEDLKRDLTTPNTTVEPNRIKRRLISLLSAFSIAATFIATGTDFVNNVFDLADKFGIPATELIQYVPPHLLP
ncbi:MAG: pentapeptide repeat-containing protein [Thainema sp.]